MSPLPSIGALTRRQNRILPRFGAFAVAFIVLASACGESPAAPVTPTPADASHSLLGSITNTVSGLLTTVTGLTWSQPVTEATVSKTIGKDGGTLSFPNGLQLIVPANAVSGNVKFSITRVPGSLVAYDFQPHGTTFAKPLTVIQPTSGLNLLGINLFSGSIQGAYYSSLDQDAGTASVSEFEPTVVSSDRITFTVKHFSGYIVASGRQ